MNAAEYNMIFETHAHYDDPVFDEDRDELLSSFPENGICRVINVGSDVKSLDDVITLTEKYPFVYGAAGIHPDEIGALNEDIFKKISDMCDMDKIVSVGEVGLDYHIHTENKPQQREWFERFIDLARNKSLPLIIHSREACEDTLDVIKKNDVGAVGAVMHCYSYSKETAVQLMDLGLYFGIGGVATFKNAKKLVEALEIIPLERLLLETDCPYLAPAPHRGERNSSLYIPLVAEKIAEIKGIEAQEVVRVTNENARTLFKKAE